MRVQHVADVGERRRDLRLGLLLGGRAAQEAAVRTKAS
jgi:hypothetical protein